MIKFVTQNNKILKLYGKFKLVRAFFVYDITKLSQIDDAQMFNSVVSSYSNSNNTSKYTYPGRFDDLNELLKQFFKEKSQKIHIHDVAISSGITTCELYDWLKYNNFNFEMIGSDRFSEVNYNGMKIKFFYDIDGQIIQIYFYKLFCGLQISNLFVLSKLLFIILKRFHKLKVNTTKIYLFDKYFSDLVLKSKITFVNFDLFDDKEMEVKFDFVRVMNVLNLIYFSENQIRIALNKFKKSLNIGGIILIGRTSLDGINNATFYSLETSNIFKTVYTVNGGYEFNYLVENF